MNEDLETYFAPAERKILRETEAEMKVILSASNMQELLNVLPYVALILNKERQIVFCNQALINMLGMKNIQEALGARPGEILQCIHSHDHIHGCGTAQSCRYCRAVNVVLQSQKMNKRVSDECRITSNMEGKNVSFDLHVTAEPLHVKGSEFTIVFISDISSLKRREQLERTFFHDIINTAGGILGLVEIFSTEGLDPERSEDIIILRRICRSLVDEVQAQRDLLAAESGKLKPELNKIYSLEMLESAYETIKYHEVTAEREIRIDKESVSSPFEADPRLVKRVIVNLLKNAIEATASSEAVQAGCYTDDKDVIFWVRNPGVLTAEVREQIFQRSFSTKGKGRGIGTYSVKLLAEQYLGGKVSFESEPEKGTTFYVNFPRSSA